MNEKKYMIDGIEVKQILPPNPSDEDEHPRPIFNGWGIHAGEVFNTYIPGEGFVQISIEMSWGDKGFRCWYVATPGYQDLCPIGLWCAVN